MTFLVRFHGNNGVTSIRLYRNLLPLFFRHSTFNSQWHLIGGIKMSVDQIFFQPPHQTRIPLSLFLFTVLCCSFTWAYFNLLIKYVRSSLCSQELNHVRLTQSPCERIFFNIININSICSSRNFCTFQTQMSIQWINCTFLPCLLCLLQRKDDIQLN